MLQYKWLQAAGRAATPRCSRSATTTSRSTRSAAPTSPTCSSSSATSPRPTQPVRLIKLEQNYRSHGHILDAANALIGHNAARLGKNLWTERRQGRAGARVRGADRHRRGGASSSTSSRRSPRDGVRARPRSRCSTARNAQSRVLEHALFSAGAAVPRLRRHALLRARRRSSTRSPTCACIAEPDDDGAFLRVVNFPPRGIGARTLEQLQDAARAQGDVAVAGRGVRHDGGQGGDGARGVRPADRDAARRDARRCRCPRPSSTCIEASGLLAHYRAEKDGQERVENLEELVNAATASCAKRNSPPMRRC